MEQKFEIGDVVVLNSEPDLKLTVNKIVDIDRVEIIYLDKSTNRFIDREFHVNMLTLIHKHSD